MSPICGTLLGNRDVCLREIGHSGACELLHGRRLGKRDAAELLFFARSTCYRKRSRVGSQYQAVIPEWIGDREATTAPSAGGFARDDDGDARDREEHSERGRTTNAGPEENRAQDQDRHDVHVDDAVSETGVWRSGNRRGEDKPVDHDERGQTHYEHAERRVELHRAERRHVTKAEETRERYDAHNGERRHQ